MSKDGLTGGAIFDIIKEEKNSPAARAIIEAAHKYDEIVYILTTGACTNVSSAIMLDPSIMEKICVIWLGDNYRYAFDKTRHKIIYMDRVDRDIVLADTFASIGSL